MIGLLLLNLLVFQAIWVWGMTDYDGLQEFVDVFYGRFKEIIRGQW